MTPLSRIKQAGFEVSLYGDGLKVTPASKLTMQQREFLKSNKAEIIGELKAEQAVNELKAEQATQDIIQKLVVTCYAPNGKPIEVEARDEEHAAWLLKMNPQGIHQ